MTDSQQIAEQLAKEPVTAPSLVVAQEILEAAATYLEIPVEQVDPATAQGLRDWGEI